MIYSSTQCAICGVNSSDTLGYYLQYINIKINRVCRIAKIIWKTDVLQIKVAYTSPIKFCSARQFIITISGTKKHAAKQNTSLNRCKLWGTFSYNRT
jgi:hypothetical protein